MSFSTQFVNDKIDLIVLQGTNIKSISSLAEFKNYVTGNHIVLPMAVHFTILLNEQSEFSPRHVKHISLIYHKFATHMANVKSECRVFV